MGKDLPYKLAIFLEAKGIECIEIIQVNARKGRWCIVGKNREGEVFLKWNDDVPTHEAYRLLLEQECAVYAALQPVDITVRMLERYPPCLITEYLRSAHTFREEMFRLSTQEAWEKLEIILDMYRKFVLTMRKANSRRAFPPPACTYVPALKFFGSLLTSGPWGTKNGFWERCRNRGIAWLGYRWLLPWIVNRLKLTSGIIYGDFHLNNVLITKEGRIHFIDFEDVCWGQMEAELLFFYVQAWVLLPCDEMNGVHGRRAEQLLEETVLDLGGSVEAFRTLLPWFKAAIYMNGRYRRGGDLCVVYAMRLWWQAIRFAVTVRSKD